MSTLIYYLDLTKPVNEIPEAKNYQSVLLYLKWHNRLIEKITLNNEFRPLGSQQIMTEVVNHLQRTLLKIFSEERLSDLTPPISWFEIKDFLESEFGNGFTGVGAQVMDPAQVSKRFFNSLKVSILICTYNRPYQLKECLKRLQLYKTSISYEVIVVDNNPDAELVEPIALKYGTRFLSEARQGLSYARNKGLKQAQGDIIICLDDDVIVSEGWLEELIKPFEDAEVMCVTSLVLPVDLTTASAKLFEEYGGLGRGFKRKEFNKNYIRQRRSSAPIWEIGATASAAFRARIFEDKRIGPFCEVLGAGTPTGCSEDTYIFYKILKARYKCVYQPASVVYHAHRSSMKELRKQLFNYSKGHVAYHLVILFAEGDLRTIPYLLKNLPKSVFHRYKQKRQKLSSYPLDLLLLECWGYLNGPWALLRSIGRSNKLGYTTPQEIARAKVLKIQA